jgi:hypothetical protein
MIRTPNGMMAEEDVLSLFDQVGFTPPAGASTEQAFQILMKEAQRQAEEERSGKRPGRVGPDKNPRHVIQRTLSPCRLVPRAPYNVASNNPQALRAGPNRGVPLAADRRRRHRRAAAGVQRQL